MCPLLPRDPHCRRGQDVSPWALMKERSGQCAQYGPKDHGGLSGECVEFVGGETDINTSGMQREENKKLPDVFTALQNVQPCSRVVFENC